MVDGETKFTIVGGLGYSDEGKGRVVQMISENYDVVMRCNGSWSSSHQIDENNILKCFHLPSITGENKTLIVGQGMIVNPVVLIEELKQDFRTRQHIYVSQECFVIENDVDYQNNINVKIGTLGSGVRDTSIKKLNHEAKKLKDVVEKYPHLIDYMIDDDEYFEMTNGKRVLVEGSHGYLIDCNFGIYPYTTSTNTTPSSIMGLTKYSPDHCEKVIFVSGLILLSLSIHPEHRIFKNFNLGHVEEMIPQNIKVDYACGLMKDRNIGPMDVNVILNVIRFYKNCDIYFTFFDIIDTIGVFYYIENDVLCEIKKTSSTEEFRNDIERFLMSKFNRRIVLCEPPLV
jgi:hypothetical protein